MNIATPINNFSLDNVFFLDRIKNTVMDDSNFIRIHKSYLINLNGVLRFHRDDGITIEMKNGSILPVSRRRQSYFLERFNNN